ncbi:helix-turn-helix domain-containing protein [Streptomyces noursei]|uniref:helix-turn-helix domain-containing protein n=1 Tax=Streptomyces noursei TaxID=1971 RepID=UPI00382DF1B1
MASSTGPVSPVPWLVHAVVTGTSGACPVAGNEQTLGKLIAKARGRKGWPQRDLAAMIDKSESRVSQAERDVIPVNGLETLRRISEVLGVPLPQLLAAAQPSTHQPVAVRRQVASARVGRNLGPEEGDDPVRRRELLAAAAVAGATPLTSATPAEASKPGRATP